MSLTISDRASAVGDPLSQGGSTTTGILWLGNEIADIVFLGILIAVGAQGTFASNMIAGTAGTADGDGEVSSYSEVAVSGFLYRLGTAESGIAGTGTASVKTLFVGQGVDGPLGVISTWTMDSATVGRVNRPGTSVDDLGQAIYGGVGVEAP